jgi:hypothetical protein
MSRFVFFLGSFFQSRLTTKHTNRRRIHTNRASCSFVVAISFGASLRLCGNPLPLLGLNTLETTFHETYEPYPCSITRFRG